MADSAPPADQEPEDEGTLTPNSAKRRKLMQPVRAGLNWNPGNKPAIRTSLARGTASKPSTVESGVGKVRSSSSSPRSASQRDTADEKDDQENSGKAAASVEPSSVAAGRAWTESDEDDSSSDSSSESDVKAPPNGKPHGSAAPSVIGSSQIDLENDELYGGKAGEPKVQSKVSHAAEANSDDDSDILQLHTDDEMDRGVMINVSDGQGMQLPVPEPTVAPAAANKSQTVPRPPDPKPPDAVIELSPDEGEIPPDPPPTLADLSTADLRLQVRYFYIGRDLATIPLSDCARCLHCACTGHLTLSCPSQMCRHCSSSEHLSTFCPEINPCTKCLAKGHTALACPEKLRNVPDLSSYTCPRCSHTGHLSSACEQLWRSSDTAYTDLPADPMAFRRECYECGRSVHLGNDCNFRQPGKPMGSSSWSAHAAAAPPVQSMRPTAPKALRVAEASQKKKVHPKNKKKGLPPPAPGLPNLPPPPAGPAQRGKPKAGRGGPISIRGVSGRGTSNRPPALQPQNHPPPQAPSGPAQQGKKGARGGKKRGSGRGGSGSGRGGGGRGGGSDAYHRTPNDGAHSWGR